MPVKYRNAVNGTISSVVNNTTPDLLMHLYDEYAGILYASIFRFTDNTAIADKILIETFIQLKGKTFPLKKMLLIVHLLRFTYSITTKYLHEKNIPQKQPGTFVQSYPVLDCVLYKASSLQEAAILLSIKAGEIKIKLHDECESLKTSLELPLKKNISSYSYCKV